MRQGSGASGAGETERPRRPQRAAAESEPPIDPPKPRHRVVQYRGRRFSLKLDDPVWRFLETLAAESDIRLNEMVARLVDRIDDASNVTAAIRSYCLEQALARIEQLRRGLDDRSLTGAGVPISLIADACPSPCFVVSQDHVIRRTNAAAQAWAGVREAGLIGKSLDHYFQVKAALPLAEIVRQFGNGAMRVFPAKILYLRPGSVVTAKANLCPAAVRGPRDLLYLVLVDPLG